MTDFIEQDALINTPDTGTPPIRDHPMHSFIATPRMDKTLLQKFRSLFKSVDAPGSYIVDKAHDGLRTMFVITSNAYMDREKETITSKALEEYEASCFPAEGVFHCDNPFIAWHDDDFVMGEIVAVNYSEPFLIEIVKEIDNPVAKLLWDFAEENGDNAGASHRFGYRDEDRLPDGTYTRIFKQETSYLPDRNLAANLGTYAGVLTPMASKQADEWFDKVVSDRTGGAIKDAAQKMHSRTGQLAEELKGLGINHKAQKPAALMDEAAGLEADAVDEIDEEAKSSLPADFMKQLEGYARIHDLVMQMANDQTVLLEGNVAMAKSIKALEAENTKSKSLEQTLKQRIDVLEARLNMAPKSVQQDKDKGATPEAIVDAVKAAEDQRKQESIVKDPFWGDLSPLPEYK